MKAFIVLLVLSAALAGCARQVIDAEAQSAGRKPEITSPANENASRALESTARLVEPTPAQLQYTPQPAFAHGDGYWATTFEGRGEIFVYETYVVEELGATSVRVYRRIARDFYDPVSESDLANPLYTFSDGPCWLGAIVGDLLVIDIGTGPDVREVVVVDLVTGKQKLRADYMHQLAILNYECLVYFAPKPTSAPPPPADVPECAKEMGVPPTRCELTYVDLRTFKRTNTGVFVWECES